MYLFEAKADTCKLTYRTPCKIRTDICKIHTERNIFICIRSYVVLQCEGPTELRATKCAFRNAQNSVEAFISPHIFDLKTALFQFFIMNSTLGWIPKHNRYIKQGLFSIHLTEKQFLSTERCKIQGSYCRFFYHLHQEL